MLKSLCVACHYPVTEECESFEPIEDIQVPDFCASTSRNFTLNPQINW